MQLSTCLLNRFIKCRWSNIRLQLNKIIRASARHSVNLVMNGKMFTQKSININITFHIHNLILDIPIVYEFAIGLGCGLLHTEDF